MAACNERGSHIHGLVTIVAFKRFDLGDHDLPPLGRKLIIQYTLLWVHLEQLGSLPKKQIQPPDALGRCKANPSKGWCSSVGGLPAKQMSKACAHIIG